MRAVHERALRELAAVVERPVIARGEELSRVVARLSRQIGPRFAPYLVGKAIALEDSHGVGIHDDAGAHRVELRRALEHRARAAAQVQLAGERKTTDAAADDEQPQRTDSAQRPTARMLAS